MTDKETARLMQQEAKFFGLQQGFKEFKMHPFAGMNQMSTSRLDGKDNESWWQENLIKTGEGCVRTLWDKGTALYTVPDGKTIIYFYSFNIGATNYFAVFLSDGTAYQINATSGASTTISSTANTFYNSGVSTQIPVCGQWGAEFLLISNNFAANNYWIWDGSILYTAGTLGPLPTITDVGSGYSSAPTVTAYGGHGSGATFTATVSSGNVVQVQVTNAGTGYEPGDVVQLRFSGGGSDDSAQLTAVLAAGAVQSVVVTNVGSGYPAGTFNLSITGGGGSSATGTYTVGAGGTVTSTAITAGGSGYTSTPSVAFTVGVLSITVTNAGSGYTPGTYALGFSGGGGSGAAGTYTVGGGGTITSTAITNNGADYTSAPGVSFPSGGGSSAAGTANLYGSGATGIVTVSAGAIASVTVTHGGSGYTGTPTLTVVGGGGSGAVLTAVLSGGAINSVTVNNGGSNYTSTPAIEVQVGLNNAAAATITIMPYGVSGSSIETFQSRVWLGFPFQTGSFQVSGFHNGDIILASAPASPSDFATSDGGVNFANTDAFLRSQYVNLKQTNGYLYPIGDSSVSVISNVQTTGNPSTTTFNYQNTDPQTGAAWRDSVQSYSRTILLANALGVYGLYGGAVTKISKQIDNIFNNAVFPASGGTTPTSAVANIYNLKVYLLNITVKDPFTNASRTIMLGWDEKNWFVASQTLALTFIGTQEINSNLMAWGTDGSTLFQLFATPNASLTKKLSSKLYGDNQMLIQKQSFGVYLQAQDLSTSGSGITISSLTVDSETGTYAIPQIPTFGNAIPPYYQIQSAGSGDVYGANLGFTLTLSAADATINYCSVGYLDVSSIAASSTPIVGTVNTE